MDIQIFPSLLAADLGNLAADIARVAGSGATGLHLDVMDGHFVPNLAYTPDTVALACRVAPALYRHVHLMMSRPDRYLEAFARAGAQTIQIHVEADCDLHVELARIRALGLRAALALNPETPVARVYPYLKACDEVLVMTVHPGLGGQAFITDCLAKLTDLRRRCPTLNLMVDGGVNAETAVQAVRAGANQLVSGSYLFKQPDMADAIRALRARIE